MNLKDALKILINGGQIRRKDWAEGYYIVLDGDGDIISNTDMYKDISKFYILFTKGDEWEEYHESGIESKTSKGWSKEISLRIIL